MPGDGVADKVRGDVAGNIGESDAVATYEAEAHGVVDPRSALLQQKKDAGGFQDSWFPEHFYKVLFVLV